MNIHIVGANGSMGKRYSAILKYLGADFSTSDVDTSADRLAKYLLAADGIILATPTATHFEFLRCLRKMKKPILCEKPLTTSLEQLKIIEQYVSGESLNLTMMAQYRLLDGSAAVGDSSYNYFRHGGDSLKWDCIQIIGLARGAVKISDDSPIWKCKLNGRELSLGDMDQAYVSSVKNWMARPGDDFGRLREWHIKVVEF